MDQPEAKKARRGHKQQILNFPVVGESSSKTRDEIAIMDYIVEDMLPLSTVESAGFRKYSTRK